MLAELVRYAVVAAEEAAGRTVPVAGLVVPDAGSGAGPVGGVVRRPDALVAAGQAGGGAGAVAGGHRAGGLHPAGGAAGEEAVGAGGGRGGD